MTRKRHRLGIWLLILSLVGYFVYTRVYSNPVTWYKAYKTVTRFLEENYPEYECVKVRNNLFGAWECMYAYAAVPDSMDKYFYVYTDFTGNYMEDSYERDVSQKLNTERRLQQRYNEKIQQLTEDEKGIKDIYGTLVNISKDLLVTDKEYSWSELAELSRQYGYLSVHLDYENTDINICAETVMKIIEILEENNLYFWNICVYVMDGSGRNVSNTGNIEYYLIDDNTITSLLSKNILPV